MLQRLKPRVNESGAADARNGQARGSRRPQSPRPPPRRAQRRRTPAAQSAGAHQGRRELRRRLSRDTVFERVEQAVEAGVGRFDRSRFRDAVKGDDTVPIGRHIADFGTKPRRRRKRPSCLVAVEIDGDEIKQSRRHDPNKTGPLADRQARAKTVDPTGSGGKQGSPWPRGISARSPPLHRERWSRRGRPSRPRSGPRCCARRRRESNLRRAAFRPRLAPPGARMTTR